jgi:hypothetical protein
MTMFRHGFSLLTTTTLSLAAGQQIHKNGANLAAIATTPPQSTTALTPSNEFQHNQASKSLASKVDSLCALLPVQSEAPSVLTGARYQNHANGSMDV